MWSEFALRDANDKPTMKILTPHSHRQQVLQKKACVLTYSWTSGLNQSCAYGPSTESLWKLMRALFQVHVLNLVTMKSLTSILLLRPTQMFPEVNYINTIGSKPVVKPLGASTELSITMNMFLQRAMVRPDVQQYERETSLGEHSSLNSIDMGKQIILPPSYFQCDEWMTQQGAASSSFDVPGDIQSDKRPRTELKAETMLCPLQSEPR